MTFRFSAQTIFGATAILALGATVAAAQDTTKVKPRSDRRILDFEGKRRVRGGSAPTRWTVYKTPIRCSSPRASSIRCA